MQVGVTFPRDGLGNDPAAMRDFAQTAEALGYDYISSGDHVIGRAGLEDSGRPVVDPLVLHAHLAAVTSRIGLVAGILVLPQRQTVLFAKQTAGLDVLSGGRLRLNVAVGWNELEYEALNEDFHNRGRRMDEQVAVLRALWCNEAVEFTGRYHRIDNAGINPLPLQRPIPLWMAGYADTALRRVARLADGWIPQTPRPSQNQTETRTLAESLALLRSYVQAEGRDLASFGINGSVGVSRGTPAEWKQTIDDWRALGATEITVSTSREKLTPAQHLEAMRRFKETVVVSA